MRCNHIEFPNSSSRRLKPCNIPLSRKLDYIGIIQPELVFPYAGIREQLATMFRRKGFKNSLRHWANRSGFDDILTDIYDGRVWKTFKGTNDETSPNFFRPEVADSHLGLMLNLDWFQPFDGTNHSTGAASSIRSNVRIRPTRTEQTLTKCVRIVRSIADKYSQSDVVAYIVKNVCH